MEEVDCKKCGACCCSGQPQPGPYVFLYPEDQEKLSKSYLQRHVKCVSWPVTCRDSINTVMKTMKAGPLKGREIPVCPSLRGSLLKQVSCAIYDYRPTVCVTYPADDACRIFSEGLVRVYKTETEA